MIKKINLTGTEQAVTFAGTHTHYWVQNLGGGTVLAGLEPELAEGKDDVLIVPSGGVGYVRLDKGTKTVYLSGTGKVQVYGTNNAFCPFKSAPKGGDEIVSSGGAITVTGTVEYPIVALSLYGKSTQDGTPTSETPVDITNVGDNGNITIMSCGKNLFPWNDYTTAPFQPNTLTSWERTSDEISVVPDIAKPASGFCIWNSQVNKNFYACDGKTITISCELWAESETTLRIGIENIKLQKFTVGNAWQKCSVTLDFALSTASKTIAWYANYSDVPFKVRNIQVEIGSVATDYEPYKGNTAEITTGLPLCSVGDVRDELGYNADGTGKIIKHIYKTVLNGSEEWKSGSTNTTGKQRIYLTIADETLKALYGSKYNPDTLSMIKCNQYISVTNNETYRCTKGISVNHIYGNAIAVYDENFATATLDEWKAHLAANPLTVIYVLNTPQEITLSAAEIAALAELQTFEGVTNIFNDETAKMAVKAATNPLLSEFVKPVINGVTARFEARIAALEAAIVSNN